MKYEDCKQEGLVVLTPRHWNPNDPPNIMAVVRDWSDSSGLIFVQWGLDDSRQTDWYHPEDLKPVTRFEEKPEFHAASLWAAVTPSGEVLGIYPDQNKAIHEAVYKYLNDHKIGWDSYYGYSDVDQIVAEWIGYRALPFDLKKGIL